MPHNNETPFEFNRNNETFGPPMNLEVRVVPDRRTPFNSDKPWAGHAEVIQLNIPAGAKVSDALTAAANAWQSHGEMRRKGQPEFDFSCLIERGVFTCWETIGDRPFFRPDGIDPQAIEEVRLGTKTRADLETKVYPANRMVTIYLMPLGSHRAPLIPSSRQD